MRTGGFIRAGGLYLGTRPADRADAGDDQPGSIGDDETRRALDLHGTRRLDDEDALLEALNAGKVAGAALVVFAQEPPGQIALVTHANVIASPHIGAQTVEAQARAAEDIAHEVLAALRGEALRWRVA